jgi:hypothetical protein
MKRYRLFENLDDVNKWLAELDKRYINASNFVNVKPFVVNKGQYSHLVYFCESKSWKKEETVKTE